MNEAKGEKKKRTFASIKLDITIRTRPVYRF